MNENNRGTPLWLIIGIAVCVSLLSIAVYDYLGLPPDWLPSDLLQEVEVRPGGLVVMHFTPESGLQGEVRLQMRVDSAAYQWDCSGNIPDIAEASDGCRYVP